MTFRRVIHALVVALALAFASGSVQPPEAEAKARARKVEKKRKGRRVCKKVDGERRCRWVAYFQGHGVPADRLRTEPLPRPSGRIHVYSVNTRAELDVRIYDDSGELDEAVLAQLDEVWRCKRTGEARAVDPRLYEMLSIIYDHFGQRRIELVSGFRFQQDEGSRHFHASAMDIRIPGVPAQALYDFAETLDAGGMGIGIYPRSGFVHIDFRAPGAKSYRWRDTSPGSYRSPGKSPSRQWKKRPKPNA